MSNDTKKWYLSKTMWVGVLTVGLAVFEAIDKGGNWVAAVIGGIGAAILILRPMSTKKLTK